MNEKISFKNSIAGKLFIGMVYLYISISTLILTVDMIYIYISETKKIEDYLDKLDNIFAEQLGRSIWSLDLDHTYSTLDGLLNFPFITSLNYSDEYGKVIYEKGVKIDSRVKNKYISTSFDIYYKKFGERSNLGIVKIYTSKNIIWREIKKDIILVFLNVIFAIFIMLFVLKIKLKSMVKDPLINFSNEIRSIKGIEVNKIKAIKVVDSDSELKFIENSFNDLILSMKEMNLKLHSEIDHKKRIEVELINAKDNAEISNKAKSEFLSNMSHEIRTPMTSIISMSQILNLTDLTMQQKKFLSNIENSSEILLSIINDILDISKIEAGKVVVENKESDFKVEIDRVITNFKIAAKKKGLKLEYFYEKEVEERYICDFPKVRQVIINLISNSIKFTDSGFVNMKISKLLERDNLVELKFVVEDSGIGMDEDVQKNIFEPFTQEDSSYSKRYQGTGLGLAISKRLIEVLGGEIYLDSKKNEGTKFIFVIPVKKVN